MGGSSFFGTTTHERRRGKCAFRPTNRSDWTKPAVKMKSASAAPGIVTAPPSVLQVPTSDDVSTVSDSWLRQLQLIAFDCTIFYLAIVVSSLFVAASYMWTTTRAIDPSDKDAGAQVVNQKWNCFLVLTFLFKHIHFK